MGSAIDGGSLPLVLMVDDDAALLRAAERLFARHARLTTSPGPSNARQVLASSRFDVVISDYTMPDEDGISLLIHVAQAQPQTTRILFTGGAPDDAHLKVGDGSLHHVVAKSHGVAALIPFLKV